MSITAIWVSSNHYHHVQWAMHLDVRHNFGKLRLLSSIPFPVSKYTPFLSLTILVWYESYKVSCSNLPNMQLVTNEVTITVCPVVTWDELSQTTHDTGYKQQIVPCTSWDDAMSGRHRCKLISHRWFYLYWLGSCPTRFLVFCCFCATFNA